jgi:hypothetical protein
MENRRTEEQKNRRTEEQKNRRTEEQKNRRTEEQKNRRTEEQNTTHVLFGARDWGSKQSLKPMPSGLGAVTETGVYPACTSFAQTCLLEYTPGELHVGYRGVRGASCTLYRDPISLSPWLVGAAREPPVRLLAPDLLGSFSGYSQLRP